MTTGKLTFAQAERNATSGSLNFANMSDAALIVWAAWFNGHTEDEYSDPRTRSYFRVNRANLCAEISWRKTGMPF